MAGTLRGNQGNGQWAGERLFLREPRPSDAAEFTSLCRISRPLHYGLVQAPVTARAFADYLKRSQQPNNVCFLISLRDGGAIVGAINIGQIFLGSLRSAYLGYFIGAPHARRGYMTEALQLALSHVFSALKLHRVEANIQPGNRASLALVKRAGFVREGFSRRYLKVCGRWRDHERWALLVEDWRRTKRKEPR